MSYSQSGMRRYSLIALSGLFAVAFVANGQGSMQTESDVGSPKKLKHLPPTGVTVDVSVHGTDVAWNPIPLKRVKRYVVLRLSGMNWVRLMEIDALPSRETSEHKDGKLHFLDRGVHDPGVQYSVAAIDVSGVQGTKSKPVSASAGK